ncbi:MAG: FUSC family protein, partial [Mesorhizobium sp.]
LLWALSAARTLHSHRAPKNAALIPMRRDLKAFVGELAATPGALDDKGPWVARLDAIASKDREVPALPDDAGTNNAAEDKVGTVTRLT